VLTVFGIDIADRLPDRLDRLRQLLQTNAKRWHQDDYVPNCPGEQPVTPSGDANLGPGSAGLPKEPIVKLYRGDETALTNFLDGRHPA
jgi:hypothetical protein